MRECPDPVLAAIGYRFDEGLPSNEFLFLAYRYHDVSVMSADVDAQQEGRVSLQKAELAEPQGPHPRVSKRVATTERLKRFAPALADAFWRINDEQRGRGVKIKYGGKNFVRYSTTRGVFAEAVVGDGVIHWTIQTERALRSEADEPTIAELLAQARNRA
jgi:hypothetical protein